MIIFIVIFLNIFTVSVHAEDIQVHDIIKVGVYEYEPYFMVDADGNISGYYYDLMKLLQTKQYFEYEFVIDTLEEGMKKLAAGEIDIMLGIPMQAPIGDDIIFNRYRTNQEIFGVFSDENINFEDLNAFKDLKLGIVEGDYNAEAIINLFKANHVNISIVYEKDYKTLQRMLEADQIDLMVQNKWKQKDYPFVYEFIGRDVYIAGRKGSEAILNSLDQAIEQITLEKENAIILLHKQYFGSSESAYQEIIASIGIIIFLGMVLSMFPLLRRKIIRNKIRAQMSRNQYRLHYQPIYNPRTNKIVGFEGLLRLIHKNNKLIPPLQFLPQIEGYNMLFEVSIWIIKKVIDDYDKIKNSFCLYEENFYVSVNISFKEIENDIFVDQVISLLKESHLQEQKICLEIVERFKMNDVDKITHNIKRLKQAGFKLAIDDFGVDYSNLDIFQKLDVDIIKVDKSIVDGMGKDALKEEIILFISKLASIVNRSVVLEGVEEASQDLKIKALENNRLYVQGYYYQKPMPIERE